MAGTLHVFDFLEHPCDPAVPVIPVFGDDRFLRSLAIKKLIHTLSGSDNKSEELEFAANHFDGDQAQWVEVYDELSTLSLFGGDSRICVVNDADKFIKNHRDQIESLAQKPGLGGWLILGVKAWPANTKLYKWIEKNGLQIDAGAPVIKRGKSKSRDDGKICDWIISQAAQQQLKLGKSAARKMLDLVNDDFGRIHNEIAKLALLKTGKNVTEQDIVDIVGGWKAKSIWEAVDHAADGETDAALLLLHRILLAGEHPLSLYGQLAWSLRRYSQAYEILMRSKRNGNAMSLRESLKFAGFRSWGGELENAERRMKRIGHKTIAALGRWLLEIDLQLKGTHSQKDRAAFAIEMLFVKISESNVGGSARRALPSA